MIHDFTHISLNKVLKALLKMIKCFFFVALVIVDELTDFFFVIGNILRLVELKYGL